MEARELIARLAGLAPGERDAVCEALLGIDEHCSAAAPGEHLIGYHASGVASIVRLLLEVPVNADDVLIDLGAGLGKVALLARLLTGATVRGIELQPELVTRARAAAAQNGVEVTFVCDDARHAMIDDGTIFFLYLPFTGPVLTAVLERLRAVAAQRAIVVCTLGMSLEREAPWLVRRGIDTFWLDIYDSQTPGVAPRAAPERPALRSAAAELIARELPALS